MSIAVTDLIKGSLQDIGVVGAAEPVSADDQADSLIRLNDWIDGLAAERLAISTITRTTWTIVSGTAAYTVGTSGTVNIARPVFVERIKFIDTSADPDLEMDLHQLTDDAYMSIPQKAQTGTYPSAVYYNPTYPLGTATFWMVPTSATLLGVIYALTAVTQVAIGDTIALPPGYQRMLRLNLKCELSDLFTRPVTPTMRQMADQSKADVKRANSRLTDLSVDVAILPVSRMWSIYTGQ